MSNLALGSLSRELNIGNTAAGNKTVFETNGFMRAEGGAIAYRDEYVSQDWGDATGQAAPSYQNFTIGGVAVRKMTLDANDARTNGFEIPHDMLYSENALYQPELHLHFRPTTNATGTMMAFLTPEWSKANASGANPVVDPVALPEMSLTCNIAQGSSAYPSYVCSFGLLPVNAYRLGDLLGFKIERRTGQGTYTDVIILDKVAMHIPIDTAGSRQRYVK